MASDVLAPEIGAAGEFLVGHDLWQTEDINPKFRGSAAFEIYDNMRCDGEIAGGLARYVYSIKSASWHVEPPEGEDPLKHEPTILARQEIFRERRGPVGSQGWNDLLGQALLMLPFGFSVMEKVWEVVDGKQVLRKIAPRAPKTFYKFAFDDRGDLSAAHQRAMHPDRGYLEAAIPADKLVLFVFGREGNNLFGRSVYRSAYGHWFLKKLLMETSAIAFERSGVGIAWIEIPTEFGTVDPTAKAEFEKTVRELRAHQRQGVFVPPGCKLHVDYPSGTAPDAVPLLNYHDQQMSRATLTEFMATGTAETGSRAVVTSKMDLMMLALQGVAHIIEETFNEQVIRDLVDRNFGPQEAYPTLQIEDMDKMQGEQKATILKLLSDAGLLYGDKPLRAQLREENDLPPEDEKTLDVPAPPVPFGTPQPNGNGAAPPKNGSEPSQNGNGNGKEPGANRVKAALSQLATVSPFRRDPYPHEAAVAFADIQQYLDEEPLRIWHRVVAPIRSEQIARIAEAAAGASDASLAQGQLPQPAKARMSTDLYRALLSAYTHGRLAVRQELKGAPVVARLAESDDEDAITATPAEQNWIRRLAEGFVSGSSIALVAAAVKEAITARQADLPKAEVERRVLRALQDLSVPTVQADLAGAVTTAYTTGRNDQGAAMRDLVESEHYSAMLDDGTCEPCASMDGMEQEPGAGAFTTPNPQCEGGLRCRCVTIYVARKEAA